MDENKKDFIAGLGQLLSRYSREMVDSITYTATERREYADIRYTDGSTQRVAITFDSLPAAMIDIAKALM